MPSLGDVETRMEKAVGSTRRDFAAIRTGKATPSVLDTVRVEAYGSMVPVNQVATVNAPEPRLLVVQPWDKSLIAAVEKGIQEADLGLNPSNDGNVIRVPIPMLTEERRKELVRKLHSMAEEGRIAVRQVRQDANKAIKREQQEGELSEDETHRQRDAVQELTDKYIARVEELLEKKEKEILEV